MPIDSRTPFRTIAFTAVCLAALAACASARRGSDGSHPDGVYSFKTTVPVGRNPRVIRGSLRLLGDSATLASSDCSPAGAANRVAGTAFYSFDCGNGISLTASSINRRWIVEYSSQVTERVSRTTCIRDEIDKTTGHVVCKETTTEYDEKVVPAKGVISLTRVKSAGL